jgi:L-rhamnose mutarotase
MKTWCLMLDLHDDPKLIDEYKWYHEPGNLWPEVTAAIRASGILNEEIYLVGTRLVMILHTTDAFTLEATAAADGANPKTQEWEQLMWKYQKALPQPKPGQKWIPMEKIFEVK